MIKRVLLGLLTLGITTCLAGAPAQAQDDRFSVFAGYAYGSDNVGCYDDIPCTSPGLHGYTGAFAYNFNDHIALEANFSGHNGTPSLQSEPPVGTSNGHAFALAQDLYTYTVGPKLTQRVGDFALFAHFLAGGAHIHHIFIDKCLQATGGETCSKPEAYLVPKGSGMALKTGGGVEWNHGHWGIRILEVDFMHDSVGVTAFGEGTPESFTVVGNNFELSTGVTFSFGMK